MTTNIIKRNNGNSNVPARSVTGWIDQLMQDNLNRFFTDDFWNLGGAGQRTGAPVNLRETDKTYEMEIIAPGLRKEDFKLQVSSDMLTVSFEPQPGQNDVNQNEGWLRREYKTQAFTRSFSLDESIDLNKITAAYNDGILKLTLAKKENAQKVSKTIEIK
jgi:HSP20 family protein